MSIYHIILRAFKHSHNHTIINSHILSGDSSVTHLTSCIASLLMTNRVRLLLTIVVMIEPLDSFVQVFVFASDKIIYFRGFLAGGRCGWELLREDRSSCSLVEPPRLERVRLPLEEGDAS